MTILAIAQKHGSYKELTPGEYAGPCPKCGGAMRFRIWPAKNRFACVHCAIEGGIDQLKTLLPVAPTKTLPADLDITGNLHQITRADGRVYYVAENLEAYKSSIARNPLTFSSGEIRILKEANLSAEYRDIFMAVKEVFPGAVITNTSRERDNVI